MTYNKTIIMGNITANPEIRYTTGGTAVSEISLAVNEKRKDASGELKEEVHYFSVTLWGKTAELVNNQIKKGDTLLVEGKLEQQRWTTNEGDNRSKVVINAQNVRFIRWGRDNQPQQQGQYSQQPAQPQFQNPNQGMPPMPQGRFDYDEESPI